MKSLFITAAIGSSDFHSAGKRIISQASQFALFDQQICVTESDLVEICPQIFDTFSEDELTVRNKYGFYSWKSSIANAAMQGFWGKYDLVFYLDAGCELVPSFWNIRKLKKMMISAENKGIVAFAINTTEREYTKKLLLENMQVSETSISSNQFQSGSWFLYGDIGRDFAFQWDQKVWESRKFIDESISPFGEDEQFIAHRHDQSVFSLLCKRFAVKPQLSNPPGPANNFLRVLINTKFPFWWARNRTGKTVIPKGISCLLSCTIKSGRSKD
jgi:hypothetical protein